jgi:cbb3-type cytochrome oxidase subunit 1
MLGLVILILALAIAPATRGQITSTMDSLDCSNSSISSFTKAACYATDLTLFHFIGGLIFIAGLVITARIILE